MISKSKRVLNTHAPTYLWSVFNRQELRDIAKRVGVKRGRNKIDTICNLQDGVPDPNIVGNDVDCIKFYLEFYIAI